MKKYLWFVGALAIVAGCVPSLHPLYTDKDVVFELGLLGKWSHEDENSKDTWTFTKGNGKEYNLVVDDGKKQGAFIAHLVKVEGGMFLDIFPKEPNLKENDFYKMHLLPAHTFMRVKQIKPTLQMAPLNPKWIEKLLEENPDALGHEKVEDRLVLTAKPKEL